MALTRVATYKEGNTALAIEYGGQEYAILRVNLPPSEATLQGALRTSSGLEIFVHYNADGSVAIAIGAEPDRWPEDE